MNLSRYEALIASRQDYELWLEQHDYAIALRESRLVTTALRELLDFAKECST